MYTGFVYTCRHQSTCTMTQPIALDFFFDFGFFWIFCVTIVLDTVISGHATHVHSFCLHLSTPIYTHIDPADSTWFFFNSFFENGIGHIGSHNTCTRFLSTLVDTHVDPADSAWIFLVIFFLTMALDTVILGHVKRVHGFCLHTSTPVHTHVDPADGFCFCFLFLLWVLCHFIGFAQRQRVATHCNTLQHTATHCNTLQHCATWQGSLDWVEVDRMGSPSFLIQSADTILFCEIGIG